MPVSKNEFRKLQKAVMKAIRATEKSIAKEPSTVIICAGETEEPEKVVGEINSWLFRRGQGNGDERS